MDVDAAQAVRVSRVGPRTGPEVRAAKQAPGPGRRDGEGGPDRGGSLRALGETASVPLISPAQLQPLNSSPIASCSRLERHRACRAPRASSESRDGWNDDRNWEQEPPNCDGRACSSSQIHGPASQSAASSPDNQHARAKTSGGHSTLHSAGHSRRALSLAAAPLPTPDPGPITRPLGVPGAYRARHRRPSLGEGLRMPVKVPPSHARMRLGLGRE